MNCLSDKEIQEYIDGECSNRQEVDQHLQNCAVCFRKTEKKKQFIEMLINEYNHSYNYSIIPEFKTPQTIVSQNKNLKKRILLISVAAAAAILFFLMIAPDTPDKKPELLMYYELEMEIDANKPLSDQDLNVVIYSNSEEQLFR